MGASRGPFRLAGFWLVSGLGFLAGFWVGVFGRLFAFFGRLFAFFGRLFAFFGRLFAFENGFALFNKRLDALSRIV
jgi:hypothetical protein